MRFTIVLCVLFVIAACTAPRPPAEGIQEQAISTVSPQPTITGAAESALSSYTPSSLSALPLVSIGEAGDLLTARPIDPLSLADLPDYHAIKSPAGDCLFQEGGECGPAKPGPALHSDNVCITITLLWN